MTIHELKTWPTLYQAMLDGMRPFEIREDDRKFKTGDVLVLREWRPEHPVNPDAGGSYTGRWALATVLSRLYPADIPFGGLEPGYVVMAINIVHCREGGYEPIEEG